MTYLEGTSELPSGEWSSEIPNVAQGNYLWTRTILTFNTGSPVTIYTKSRQGVDGEGSPGSSLPLGNSDSGEVGTSLYYARQDHRHPFTDKALTVSSSSGADIMVNDSAITTLHRAYARQYGNLVVFSFVATVGSVPQSTKLFQISEEIMPAKQVDFILLSSTAGAVAGQLMLTSGYGDRIINVPLNALNGGTLRGEISWVIGFEEFIPL